MIVPICITTGTTEGALTRNLNRKHRRASEKNGFPGGKEVGDSQSRPAIALIHRTPLIRVATNVGSAMRSQVQAAVYPRVVSIPPGNLPLAGGAGWRSLHHYQGSTLREARVAVLRVVMWQPQVPKKPNEIWRSPAQHSEKIYFVICKAALNQSANGVGRAKRFAEDAGYRRHNSDGNRLFQIRH